MDRATRLTAQQWLQARESAVVIQVADTQGSVPREAGARMLVSAAGSVGSIGGGQLEWQAVAHAREMLRTHERAPHTQRVALGPSLGQCCGGALTLHYESLDEHALARWPEAPPLAQVQLYGAGHVGCAIAALLATLDVELAWIDEREAQFPAATPLGAPWPPHVERVCVDAVEAEVAHAPPGAHYLVLTHRHDLDMRITEAILQRGDFAYLGLIGSHTKRQRFVHRFERRGLPAETIARMTCPIGIEGITGKQPEHIAVAVVAQLLMRTGRA